MPLAMSRITCVMTELVLELVAGVARSDDEEWLTAIEGRKDKPDRQNSY